MHFNEFTAELLQAAAVHDAAVSFKKPSDVNRQVNSHDIYDHEDHYEYQSDTHDIDPEATQLMMYQGESNSSQRPSRPCFPQGGRRPMNRPRPSGARKVLMDIKTWKSLTPEDQKSWDTVTEDGKRKILTYAEQKAIQADKRTISNHDVEDQFEFEEVRIGNREWHLLVGLRQVESDEG